MENAAIDSLVMNGNNMQAGGDVASRLLASNFDVNALRTNDVLRRDEWIDFDSTVVEVTRERLGAVADLINAGLRYDIPNGLGTTRLEWERSSDITDAEISMAGVTSGQRDRQEFNLASIPLPIFHKDFRINIRALESSRKLGLPMDKTLPAMATRKVAEITEATLFSGATIAGTNGTIYGYMNAPNRNTGSVTASWATATGAQIVTDTLAMISAAVADNMFGPYTIYVSYAAYVHMGEDHKLESDKTILDRVMAIPAIAAVKPSTQVTGTNVLMVQMTSDVVDMVIGQQPTTVQWATEGGFIKHFKVLSIMVPRIKDDYDGRSGIVHYS